MEYDRDNYCLVIEKQFYLKINKNYMKKLLYIYLIKILYKVNFLVLIGLYSV